MGLRGKSRGLLPGISAEGKGGRKGCSRGEEEERGEANGRKWLPARASEE